MTHRLLALVLWLLILGLAVPYVARIRHPRSEPVAAYLIFVTVLSVVALILFVVFSRLAIAAGFAPALADPVGAVAFLVLVFVLAFLLATWQARRPPRPPPRLG